MRVPVLDMKRVTTIVAISDGYVCGDEEALGERRIVVSDEPTRSDLKRIDQMTDEDIDYSDVPEVDAAFFETARVVVPPGKKQVTVRIDGDVLEWLKGQGRGYQTRINAILRAYYEAHVS